MKFLYPLLCALAVGRVLAVRITHHHFESQHNEPGQLATQSPGAPAGEGLAERKAAEAVSGGNAVKNEASGTGSEKKDLQADASHTQAIHPHGSSVGAAGGIAEATPKQDVEKSEPPKDKDAGPGPSTGPHKGGSPSGQPKAEHESDLKIKEALQSGEEGPKSTPKDGEGPAASHETDSNSPESPAQTPPAEKTSQEAKGEIEQQKANDELQKKAEENVNDGKQHGESESHAGASAVDVKADNGPDTKAKSQDLGANTKPEDVKDRKAEENDGAQKKSENPASDGDNTGAPLTPATKQAPIKLALDNNKKASDDEHQDEGSQKSRQNRGEVTLETLVKTGSNCEKQQIVAAFVQKVLNEGRLKQAFSYMEDPPAVMEKCRQLVKKPPTVCKVEGGKKAPTCGVIDLGKLVGTYLTYSVCTVEAALNQMYHDHYGGQYIANDINNFVRAINGVFRIMPDARETFGEALHILETVMHMFLKAEKALVSAEVQSVLYKRWALLDSVLCGVASEETNDVMDNINADTNRFSAQAVVDLERFIASSTEVFLQAYKPLEELVAVFEQKLLVKAMELNNDDFRRKAQLLVDKLAQNHIPSIPGDTLDSMRGIPHAGLSDADVDSITAKMSPKISLVQSRAGVTSRHHRAESESVSPNDAFRAALLRLNIFTIHGDHIVPKIDVKAVSKMVRDALLNFSEEEMVSRLIVEPQAALRVFYDTVKSLVPLPNSDMQQHNDQIMWMARFGDVAKIVEDNFNSLKQSVMRHQPEAPTIQKPTQASMLQLYHRNPRDAHEWSRQLRDRAVVTLESRRGGAVLEGNTDTYVELQPFQKDMASLVHIKAYNSATFAGMFSVVLVMVFAMC